MSSMEGEEQQVHVATDVSSTQVNNTVCKNSIIKSSDIHSLENATDIKCSSECKDTTTISNNNNNTIDSGKDVTLTSKTNGGEAADCERAKNDTLCSPKQGDGGDGGSVCTTNHVMSPPPQLNCAAATTSSSNVNSVSVCKEPERIVLTTEQLTSLSNEEVVSKWCHQDKYIASLLTKLDRTQKEVEELRSARENEDRLKLQLAEAQRKEQYCIMRLSSKENELQELGAQIQELKTLTSGSAGLKHSLLDPAVNLLFERLKRDLDSMKSKFEETQNELSAWKFTPDSNTGKQLMAKCRLLIKENDDLGKMISSGRLAKLESDLALQRNCGEELKKSQSEWEEFVLEMDEDTEGMQGTILYLQEQLRQNRRQITQLTTTQGCSSGHQSRLQDLQVKSEPSCEDNNVDGDDSEDSRPINGDVDVCSDGILPSDRIANGRKRTQSLENPTDGETDNAGDETPSTPPPLKRTRPTADESKGEEMVVENGVGTVGDK